MRELTGSGRDLKNRSIKYSFGLLGMVLGNYLEQAFSKWCLSMHLVFW